MKSFSDIVHSKEVAVGFFTFLLLSAAGVIAYRYMQLEPIVRHGAPVLVSDVTKERIEDSLRSMGDWVRANQREDGGLPYRYTTEEERELGGSNAIRHMITVQGLRAMAHVLGDSDFATRATRLEEVLLEEQYEYDASRGYAYIREGDEIKLGAAALTVLASREGKTESTPLSPEEKALGAFLVAMQRDDGSFQTFLQEIPTDSNDRFYSGEALFALAKLHQVTGAAEYMHVLERGLSHYNQLLRASFFPQYAPWHIMAYATLYATEPDDAYAEYVFYLADALVTGMLDGDIYALPDELGRFYNPARPDWGPSHSSSTGIYVEGLTYAYELALARGDEVRAERYRAAILLGTRSLIQVQWTPDSAAQLKNPERAVGALRETVTDGSLRLDQLGHAANALARILALGIE